MIRRRLIAVLARAGGVAIMAPFARLLPVAAGDSVVAAQEQAPSRRELTVTATDFKFAPDRIEVAQDELVRVTVRSGDIAHSFNIDEYRIAKRVPPGGSVVVDFRADRVGSFPFYCNMTSESGHDGMRGQLVVRAR